MLYTVSDHKVLLFTNINHSYAVLLHRFIRLTTSRYPPLFLAETAPTSITAHGIMSHSFIIALLQL